MAVSVRLRDLASSCLWWKNLRERQNESGNSLIPCHYQKEGIWRTVKCWCLRYAGGCNICLKIWSSGFISKSSSSSCSHYLECPYPHNSFARVANPVDTQLSCLMFHSNWPHTTLIPSYPVTVGINLMPCNLLLLSLNHHKPKLPIDGLNSKRRKKWFPMTTFQLPGFLDLQSPSPGGCKRKRTNSFS